MVELSTRAPQNSRQTAVFCGNSLWPVWYVFFSLFTQIHHLNLDTLNYDKGYFNVLINATSPRHLGLHTVPYYGYGRIFTKFPVTRTVKSLLKNQTVQYG